MIKLVCEKCDQIWYTANTNINQKCCECGEILMEVDFIGSKEIETMSKVKDGITK